jgi:hypothetical protein
MICRLTAAIALATAARLGTAAAQPLAPVRDSGQSVTPAFEGWYRNPDGTFSLSFGYFNRNAKETIVVPVGRDNAVAPLGPNAGQPEHFSPRRHWGVFAVTVPADFGNQRVTWTLVVRGDTFAVPGSLKRGWEIDALAGEAGTGNTPPTLRFDPGGPEGQGPRGITAGPLAAVLGRPLPLVVWASDDGKAASSIVGVGRQGVAVTLTWFAHQGPGPVRFSEVSPPVGKGDGKATTMATFGAPGEYLLRVRANDASGVVGAGHAQCCWTNGFVKVIVTP